jgi:hypothetical protein
MIVGIHLAVTCVLVLSEWHATSSTALVTTARANDAKAIWIEAGRPIQGVHEVNGWIFAGHREAVDPDSAGFDSVDMDACKQTAMDCLVRHCAGEGKFDSPLAAPLNALVDGEMWSWYSGKLRTAGSIWIEARRTGGHDVAVIALPAQSCRAMPKRAQWRDHLIEVARESQNWIVVAAVAETVESADKAEAEELVASRLRGATPKAAPVWPTAFVKVPNPLGPDDIQGLGLGDLARLAAIRPGDRLLWEALAKCCLDLGLLTGAETVRKAPTALGWPIPAPTEGSVSWQRVPVGDLPPALVAVVRSGGSIPATQAPPLEASKLAQSAFFDNEPDLAVAESKAREASAVPDADALNLLAAIRLARADADKSDLLQSLALSTQASAIAPAHPFARVNSVRALQRLGWRDSVQTALSGLPAYPDGSWQKRQADSIEDWLSSK